MKSNQHTEREINKTMQAFDDMERATTDPFFYSRLQAKLEHRNEPEYKWALKWDFGFTFTFAVILFFISLNLLVLSGNIHIYESEPADRETFMEELAADYQVIDLSYFEPPETEEE